jgi:hypothetical protein
MVLHARRGDDGCSKARAAVSWRRHAEVEEGKGMAVPNDPAELHQYVLEMLAEMIEHYGVPIPITNIEAHVRIKVDPRRRTLHYKALTSAGEELLECIDGESSYYNAEVAAGREPVQREWTWKLITRQ